MVEEKMKRLLSFPPSLPLPPPDYMLKHVFWLRNDAKLIAYIKVHHFVLLRHKNTVTATMLIHLFFQNYYTLMGVILLPSENVGRSLALYVRRIFICPNNIQSYSLALPSSTFMSRLAIKVTRFYAFLGGIFILRSLPQ